MSFLKIALKELIDHIIVDKMRFVPLLNPFKKLLTKNHRSLSPKFFLNKQIREMNQMHADLTLKYNEEVLELAVISMFSSVFEN